MVKTIELPGDLVGYYEAALYAKVTGYLERIPVDKGDWVKKGETLAEIQVPELRSNLAHARASLEIQRVTYDRLRRVQQSDPRLVSQQDVDVAYAKFREAEENVHTLETMVGYTRIIAPFGGVITGRFADPGALIRAGGSDIAEGGSAGLISPGATEGAVGHRAAGPVLTMAMIDRLRVYLYVPERDCPLIHQGTPATLKFDEFPGRSFSGKVARFATSLDLSTRTMMTEIDIDNPARELYPRMYAHVTLELRRDRNALRLPASAIFRAGDSSCVYVVKSRRLCRVQVSTGIEDGSWAEITSGLKGTERVVTTASPELRNHELVRAEEKHERLVASQQPANEQTSSANVLLQ